MPSPRLRRADPSGPGIARRRHGKGFTYLDAAGQRVDDPATLARIRSLVIPPAWRDVWICPHPNGHIQARGVDQRGRLQYIYHPRWRQRRAQAKFDRMVAFARALPQLRRTVAERLSGGEDLGRERVLAASVRLLELGFFRIGTEGYAEENHTYGLATIRKDHVTLSPGATLVFDYIAKSGKRQVRSVVDPTVFGVVAALKRRRGGGPELLAYRQGRTWVDVRSSDINATLKELTGGDFTAKDFRTWTATVLGAVALAVSTRATSPTARKRAVARAMQEVAHYLGNTPAVARSSYVDPRIIDRYHAGETIADALAAMPLPGEAGHGLLHASIEEAVLGLLDGEGDADAEFARGA